MGIANLWSFLRSAGLVTQLKGDEEGGHAEIVRQVQGKVVAIGEAWAEKPHSHTWHGSEPGSRADLSLWVFQARLQPQLAGAFESEEARCAKVAFERVRAAAPARRPSHCSAEAQWGSAQAIHWLRYGCIPVGVLDGLSPEEKNGALRRRRERACLDRLLSALTAPGMNLAARRHERLTGTEWHGSGGGCTLHDHLASVMSSVFSSLVRCWPAVPVPQQHAAAVPVPLLSGLLLASVSGARLACSAALRHVCSSACLFV